MGRAKCFALLCLAITAALALTTSPALALETHPVIGSFGPEGSSGSATFANVQGVAVDQTSGNVYVYDTGEGGKIYKFDAAGNPVDFSSTATNVIEGVGGAGNGEEELAVAPAGSPGGSAGNIYAAKTSAVLVFAASGAQVGELTGGETCGVATDPAGHVFVGVYPNTIREYTPTANAPFTADLTATSTASYPGSCNIAADGLGNVYAAEYGGAVITKLAGIEAPTGTSIEPGARTLAVDPATNDLYADRGDVIAQYDSAANLISSFGSGLLSGSRGIAVKDGGNIYVGNGTTVEVFGPDVVVLPDATTEAASEVKRTSATLNGTISADGGPDTTSCEFQYASEEDFNSEGFKGAASVPCEPAGPFSGTAVEAVKADLTGLDPGAGYYFRLFAANENGANPGAAEFFITAAAVNLETKAASALKRTGATLNATINPEGVELEECFFEFGESEALGQTLPCAESPATIGAGEGPVPVHVDVSGLTANTEYHFRIVAKNSLGTSEGDAETFETFGPPTIAGQSFSEVSTTGAKITASINPHGEATSFQVEYVGEADYLAPVEGGFAKATKVPVPAQAIGSGVGPVEVAQQLSGLAPETGYHFRVVATNAAGPPVVGPDQSFTTFVDDSGLPDGRAYEMVSPPQKAGEVFVPAPIGNFSGTCPSSRVGCLPGKQLYLSPMQASPDGEAVTFQGQPFGAGLAAGPNQYLARRTSGGWATQSLSSPLFASASNQAYKAFASDLGRSLVFQIEPALAPEAPSREGVSFANLYLREADGALRALITEAPPQRAPGELEDRFFVEYEGANEGTAAAPALSHVVFQANDALTEEVPGVAPVAPEIEAGQLCEKGQNCNLYEWSEGQLRLVNVLPGNGAAAAGSELGSGRELLFNSERERGGAANDHAISADGRRIFWSEEASQQVYVRIDGQETVKIKDPGAFLTASTDGARVLLSDGCLYDLGTEECEDLTLDQAGVHQGGFEGILGAAEDLSRVYFVDTAALTPEGEENANGEHAEAGAFNLYTWSSGESSFIGALLEGDSEVSPEPAIGDWKPSSGSRSAQVSADGRYLAFASEAPLTGYGNQRAGGGACRFGYHESPACDELFEYDAEAENLVCASCGPSGAPPLGGANLALIERSISAKFTFPQPSNLSAEGRLFFESLDILAPGDANGEVQDVYEWKPNGVGGCARVKGCVSLISSGHSANDSFFLDATPSGDDVFFVTREQLLGRDKDDLLDLYDARVGGGFAEGVAAPCGGGACRDPFAPAPAPPSPASSTFNGPANKKPACRKQQKCHKQKRKHRKHKQKRQHKAAAKHNRGGSK